MSKNVQPLITGPEPSYGLIKSPLMAAVRKVNFSNEVFAGSFPQAKKFQILKYDQNHTAAENGD